MPDAPSQAEGRPRRGAHRRVRRFVGARTPARPSDRGLVAGCYLVTGVLLLAGVLFRVGRDADERISPELRVSVRACLSAAAPLGGAEVLYTVTNPGKNARSATLHVEYRDDAGHKVGAATIRTGKIGPGTSVVSGKLTPLRRPPPVVRCAVSIVR